MMIEGRGLVFQWLGVCGDILGSKEGERKGDLER